MSSGGDSLGTAGTLDVGLPGTPVDNPFTRASTVAGGSFPYWSGWWSFTSTGGHLILDLSDTDGVGTNDTYLNIYASDGVTLVYADDDSGAGLTSRLAVDLDAGAYYVQAGSFDSDGDGITTYHLAASFVAVPVLPNPRTFTVPGGTVTGPGIQMGPAVVGAPTMPPLSVSTPTDGSIPDATFIFDATTYLAALGVPSANIIFDATLSYLTDGTADTTSPEVGLNVFSVPHPMPFTYEETWDTIVVGVTDGVDDSGRAVPRGQFSQFVESGTVYIIQLTTPPGNAVRFILRVSAFGTASGWVQPDDVQWTTSTPPDVARDNSGTSPLYLADQTIPFVKATPVDTSFGGHLIKTLKLGSTFNSAYQLARGFGPDTVSPGTDASAASCEWHWGRLAPLGGNWWTQDGTVDGGPPGACLTSLPQAKETDDTPSPIDSGGLDANRGVGWGYHSEGVLGSGDTASYYTNEIAERLDVTSTLALFPSTAGVNPSDYDALIPGDYIDGSVIQEDDLDTRPELVRLDVALNQSDNGDNGGATIRFYGAAVDVDRIHDAYDPLPGSGSDGWRYGWGPHENPNYFRGATFHPDDETPISWVYNAAGATSPNDPEGYAGLQDFDYNGTSDATWTEVPPTTLAAAIAYEAAARAALAALVDDGSEAYLQELAALNTYVGSSGGGGGLRFTSIFDEHKSSVAPTPAPAFTVGEELTAVSTWLWTAARLTLRPGRIRFIDVAVVPVAVVTGGVERSYPRSDGRAMNPSPRSYPPPPLATRNYPVQP